MAMYKRILLKLSGESLMGEKQYGIDELIDHAIHVARYRETPGRIDFCEGGDQDGDENGAVHRCIHAVVHLIEDHARRAGLPTRFAATKLIEDDEDILDEFDSVVKTLSGE